MIIYGKSIKEFMHDCEQNKLSKTLQNAVKEKVGTNTSFNEIRSWENSLYRMYIVVKELTNKENIGIALEYNIPATRNRVDVILVGSDKTKKSQYVVVELKQWSEVENDEHSDKLLIPKARYKNSYHPLKQVEDYVFKIREGCNLTNDSEVDGIAYLHNYESIPNDPLKNNKYTGLINKFALFFFNEKEQFVNLLNTKFNGTEYFNSMQKLENLKFDPTDIYTNEIVKSLNNLRLTESQQDAYNALTKIDFTGKQALIINGGAGTGKTIVGIKALLHYFNKGLNNSKNNELAFVMNSEVREIYKRKIDDPKITQFIRGAKIDKPEREEKNKNPFKLVIIDEAHKASWQGPVRNEVKNFAKATENIVLLIDDDQVINKNGMSISEATEILKQENFEILNIDLTEQFRAMGDPYYTNWLDYWIYNKRNKFQEHYVVREHLFEVLDDKGFVDQYKKDFKTHGARLLTMWVKKYGYKKMLSNPNDQYIINIANNKFRWYPTKDVVDKLKKAGIKVSKEDKKRTIKGEFVLGITDDRDIGYITQVHGADIDYNYVYIPDIIYYDNGEVKVDYSKLDLVSQIWSIKTNLKKDDWKIIMNEQIIRNRLKVLLTRGVKKTVVCCEDKKLQEYLKTLVKSGI